MGKEFLIFYHAWFSAFPVLDWVKFSNHFMSLNHVLWMLTKSSADFLKVGVSHPAIASTPVKRYAKTFPENKEQWCRCSRNKQQTKSTIACNSSCHERHRELCRGEECTLDDMNFSSSHIGKVLSPMSHWTETTTRIYSTSFIWYYIRKYPLALFHDYWFFTILDPAVVSGVWILVNSVKQEKGEKGHRENAEKSYCEE